MAGSKGVWAAVKGAAINLDPGYFAMVMATGIISVAMHALGFVVLSDGLFWAAVAVEIVLVAAVVVRAVYYPGRLWADLCNPKLMFSFFTFVAANGVLGERLLQTGDLLAAKALWAVAALAWLLLTYFTVSRLFLFNERPAAEIVSGGWLLLVVGTQSISILSTLLARQHGAEATFFWASAYVEWDVGVVLYGLLIALIAFKLAFTATRPDHLTPPYWINMGAVAISTVAGANLLASESIAPFLAKTAPFLYMAVLGLWSWATWWIPLLIILGVWKHVVQHSPMRYEPGLWGMVFPLGMYTVATWRVAEVTGLNGLRPVAHGFLWVALAAWLAVIVGLVHRWFGNVANRQPAQG